MSMDVTFYFADNKVGWKKLGGEVIKDVEGTSFDHFAIGLGNDEDEVIYESVFPKSRAIFKNEWLEEYEVKYSFSFSIPTEKYIEVVDFLNSMLGKWYAVDQCIWIALITWFKIKKQFSDKVTLNGSINIICTELGYLFCKKFFKGEWNLNQDRVDLKDMFLISSELIHTNCWRQDEI